MTKATATAPRKRTIVANGGTEKYTKLEERLSAAENKVETLLKGIYAGHAAAAKALPKQRPGRQPRATA